MRQRPAERWVAVFFLSAAGAAGGFVAAYALAASSQLLGLLLAVAFAALAAGLILWAGSLLPSGTYVEKRPPMQPPKPQQTAFVETLKRGGSRTPNMVRRTLVLAGLALGAAAVVPLRGLLMPGYAPPGRALAHTPWRRGKRLMTRAGDLVTATDIAVGTSLTVFPEGEPDADDASATLVRLDPRDLNRAGAGSAAGAADGIVVFSKLCTHAGCPVGLYEQTSHQLFCPCHQSIFDVIDKGRAIAGPAVRPLPQLPVTIDAEGYVTAAGDFDGQVGPTYWRPA